MRRPLAVCIVSIAIGTSVVPNMSAQSRSGQAFSGVWQGFTQTQLNRDPELKKAGFAFTAEPPPMLPWAKEKFEANRDPSKEANDHGRIERDPGMQCYPAGPTWLHIQPRPFEFLEVAGRILIHYEWDRSLREIWMDGRGHPEGLDPSWMGHSIGKWEGDVLVVDTVGITDQTWLDMAGHVHSDALHIIEKFSRKDAETLVVEITFDDPVAYSKPWTGQRTFKLRPGLEVTEHVACETHLIREHKLP